MDALMSAACTVHSSTSSARHGSSAQLGRPANRPWTGPAASAMSLGPTCLIFSDGPMGQRPTPLVLSFPFSFFFWLPFSFLCTSVCLAPRRDGCGGAAIAGGEDGRSREAGLAHAWVAPPRRRPRGGVRRVDDWPPARPRISTAFRRSLFPARVLVRDRCETRLLGFPACKLLLLLLLLHFLFSLGGSGHGFHWSRVVDPATRQSFLQCLARFQERKLS